jgi:hypothetical protein
MKQNIKKKKTVCILSLSTLKKVENTGSFVKTVIGAKDRGTFNLFNILHSNYFFAFFFLISIVYIYTSQISITLYGNKV